MEEVGPIRRFVRDSRWRWRKAAIETNRRLGAYRNVTWFLGDGRSGTTWIANLLNTDGRYRSLFEPVHPFFEPEAYNAGLKPHDYLRPGDENSKARLFLERVMTGKFKSGRADRENTARLHQGLVVKDIFANLLAKWACDQFPHVKPVLILRHPFAVAASKANEPDMRWISDPEAFLKQPKLIADFLNPYTDLIETAPDDLIMRYILIWAIINFVPLQQFSADRLHILFYEDVYQQPEHALPLLFAYLEEKDCDQKVRRALASHSLPSRVATPRSTVTSGQSPLTGWKNQLTPAQIEQGLAILSRFGFDHVYSSEPFPDRTGLAKLRPATPAE